MKTYEELKEEILGDHRKERQALIDIIDVYNLALKVAEYYKKESGSAQVEYHPGWHSVSVALRVKEGKHPIKEALILIDEILYPEEYWIEETQTPDTLHDEIYWRFGVKENKNLYLSLCVVMKAFGGCRHVGTGRYQEIMEWRCD